MATDLIISLRYGFLAIGLFFSVLNLIILLLERLLRNTFCQAFFLIQLCYFCMQMFDITYDFIQGKCAITGVIFYTAKLYASAITLYLLLWIYRLVQDHQTRLERYKYRWSLFLLLLCFGLQYVLVPKYEDCGLDHYKFYCGVCQLNPWHKYYALVIDDILPGILLGIMVVMFVRMKKTIRTSNLEDNQKLGLRIIYFPIANMIFSLVNMMDNQLAQSNELPDWLLMTMNQLFYLIPVFNFFFFRAFMRDFKELHEIDFRYFGFLLEPNTEDNKTSTVLSDYTD